MRQAEPVIEESRAVEDVHHLRLTALLHELVRAERNRALLRRWLRRVLTVGLWRN